MEAKWIHKIVKVGSSLAVILPSPILSQLRWQKGDAVVISFIGGDQISVRPLSSYLQSLPKGEREIIKL